MHFKPFAKDPVIDGILEAIGKLYAVEKQAAKEVEGKNLDGAEAVGVYARLRAERSQPQLVRINQLLVQTQPCYPKGSDQRKAIDFLLNHWDGFTAYAQRGDLPVDNNDAERALRMIVVGRKSWMLIGSEDAAPAAATLFTVVESCRLCRVEPRAYLNHVVQQLHKGVTDPALLTPRALVADFPLRE